MSANQVSSDENILLVALRAVEEDRNHGPTDLVAEYLKHFTTAVPVPTPQQQVFERFSLVDPTIQLTVRSTTAPDV